jgi:hypothetical protein
MGLLSRLFHRERSSVPPMAAARIDEAIGRILAIHPRIAVASRYRHRLKEPIAVTLDYADELMASLPATLDASADAWAGNPSLRAFFATPDDIADTFGRSQEVRGFFESNPDAVDVHGTLGMALNERHVLGVALDGDTLHHDVAQTTLSFSDHRVRVCGRTETSLREEIERRLIDQLALEGLSMLAATRAARLARGRELMQERVALLHRGGTGLASVAGGGAAVEASELAHVQTQIAQSADRYHRTRTRRHLRGVRQAGGLRLHQKPAYPHRYDERGSGRRDERRQRYRVSLRPCSRRHAADARLRAGSLSALRSAAGWIADRRRHARPLRSKGCRGLW